MSASRSHLSVTCSQVVVEVVIDVVVVEVDVIVEVVIDVIVVVVIVEVVVVVGTANSTDAKYDLPNPPATITAPIAPTSGKNTIP